MKTNWAKTKLGELVSIRSGYAFKSSEFTDVGIPVVKIANVKDGSIDLLQCSYVSPITAARASEFNLSTDDLLITLTGNVGEIGRVRQEGPLVLNQRVGKVESISSGCDLRFIETYLRWGSTRSTLISLAAGLAQPNISPRQVEQIEIALPSLAEQRRIVDVIESVDTYIAALEKRAETARTARSALLHDLLSSPSPDWAKTRLDQVALLQIGRTPTRATSKYWTEDLSNPFCTIADMDGKWVVPSREGVTEAAIADGKARRVKAGSLLMSFKLTLGRVGFAATDLFPNEAIVAISPLSDSTTSEYLYLWLGSQNLSGGSGRAVKGETLNSKSLALIPVSLPPLAEQRRIVDVIESVDADITALEKSFENARNLRAALLSDLLSGNHEIPTSYDELLGAA